MKIWICLLLFPFISLVCYSSTKISNLSQEVGRDSTINFENYEISQSFILTKKMSGIAGKLQLLQDARLKGIAKTMLGSYPLLSRSYKRRGGGKARLLIVQS